MRNFIASLFLTFLFAVPLTQCAAPVECRWHDQCGPNLLCISGVCEELFPPPPSGHFVRGSQMSPCLDGWGPNRPETRSNSWCLSGREKLFECNLKNHYYYGCD